MLNKQYRIVGNFWGRKLLWIFVEKIFADCPIVPCQRTPHYQILRRKLFANSHKTAKFAKVFSLKSFPLHSTWTNHCTGWATFHPGVAEWMGTNIDQVADLSHKMLVPTTHPRCDVVRQDSPKVRCRQARAWIYKAISCIVCQGYHSSELYL